MSVCALTTCLEEGSGGRLSGVAVASFEAGDCTGTPEGLRERSRAVSFPPVGGFGASLFDGGIVWNGMCTPHCFVGGWVMKGG